MADVYKQSFKQNYTNNIELSIFNCGIERCAPGQTWGPGIRDHYLIHYIISGSGTYIVGKQQYHLQSGDTFLVYPNTEVTYFADREDPWEYCWVGFTGSDASIILNATDFTREQPVIKDTPEGDAIKCQLLHIYDARGNEFKHAVEMTGRLYTALALFMHNATKNTESASVNQYVQKGIEYISANYSYPITVEDIASYVGLSRSHLFRSFETVLGQSPKEYLTEFRMKQACYLLEHSSLSVTAIAISVGFDNSLYFSKTFHRANGLSPREYRQSKKSP